MSVAQRHGNVTESVDTSLKNILQFSIPASEQPAFITQLNSHTQYMSLIAHPGMRTAVRRTTLDSFRLSAGMNKLSVHSTHHDWKSAVLLSKRIGSVRERQAPRFPGSIIDIRP